MSVTRISQEEFESYGIARVGFSMSERAWFYCDDSKILGTVVKDPFDKDWSIAVLGKNEEGEYSYIDGDVSIDSQHNAEIEIINRMTGIDTKGSVDEQLYRETKEAINQEETSIIIRDIDEEVKKYFHKYPEKLYDLSHRKFGLDHKMGHPCGDQIQSTINHL